jgi:hydrogenase maturation protein HypF
LLVVNPDRSWLRVGHLSELLLTEAGDALADPARVAAGYLDQVFGRVPAGLRFDRAARSGRTRQGRGSPVATTSLGRLFDAVAAITGACRRATFEGQAPAALEALADPAERGRWRIEKCAGPDGALLLRADSLIALVVQECIAGVPPARVAARFHNTVVAGLVELAAKACSEYGLDTVVLSGGSLANTILRTRVSRMLAHRGFTVHRNELVPANDGGICLGQAVAAGGA